MGNSSQPVAAFTGTLQSKGPGKAASGRAAERAAAENLAENLAAAQAETDMMESRAPDGGELAGEDAAPAAAAQARAQANQTSQLNKKIAELEAELAARKKINELRTKVYVVKFLTAFCEILIFLAMMVWQDADSQPPSGVKRHRSAPKSDTYPVRARGIQAGYDLNIGPPVIKTEPQTHGGIMHALQPEV